MANVELTEDPLPKILPVARLGNPFLNQVALPVNLNNLEEAREIVVSMKYTLDSIGERIELAAPQVFINQRIIIFHIPDKNPNARYNLNCESVPFTVMVNPEIKPLSEERNSDWEACISVPGLMGKVDRYTHIHYAFYDLSGQWIERTASNFHARVIQHECDHLDGILFPYRMTDFKTLGYEEETLMFHKN